MDIGLYVLVFACSGLVIGLASAAFGWEKFAWCVCLPTSIAYVALPFVLAPHLEEILRFWSRLLQPHFAYTVLNLWLFLCILCGLIGIVICIVTAFRRFKRTRRVARP